MVDYQKEVGWVLIEEDGRLSVRGRMGVMGGEGMLSVRGGMGFNGGRW